MKKDKIFDDRVRHDLEFSKHLDDTFDFYDRTARPEFMGVRDLINTWFEDYPDSEKFELMRRFKKTFSSAFFELFIYQLFRKQGFKLVPHPIVDGSTKRPDFLASKNNIEFYIEAKEATDKTELEIAKSKKENAIYDSINKLNTTGYWLIIKELHIKGNKQPSGKKIAEAISKKISELGPNFVPLSVDRDNYEELGDITIDNLDIRIVINLLPKKLKNDGGVNSGVIGLYPITTEWGGPEGSIRTSIRKKASRYGKLDKPYLICINALSKRGVGQTAIECAILGTHRVKYSDNPKDRNIKWEYAKDGVFVSESGPQLTSVSGLFVTRIFPLNIHDAPHWIYKHPYAQNELDFSVLDLGFEFLVDSNWQSAVGKSVGDILGSSIL